MRTYSIAIVDDTEEDLKRSEKLISESMKKRGIPVKIEGFSNGYQLVSQIEEERSFDVFLLDLELPGYSGFELADKIRQFDMTSYIIFYTSHDHIGHVSYKYHPFATIYKTLDFEGIISVVNESIDEIIEKEKSWYVIKKERKLIKFTLKDIICIERDSKNAVFYMENQREYKERISIKELYNKLPQDDFVIVNSGTIVNMDHIVSVENTLITLDNEIKVLISTKKANEVRRKVMDYYGR